MSKNDKMREAFKEWAQREYRHVSQYNAQDFKHGLNAWQARDALAREEMGELVQIAGETAHQLREAMMHLTSENREFWQSKNNAIMKEFEFIIKQTQEAISRITQNKDENHG